MSEKVAIIGVGRVGARLGTRLAQNGFEVLFGIRQGKDIADLLADAGGSARAATVQEAVAEAEVVFLAVPAHAAVAALEGTAVDGKIIVDCTNPLRFEDGPIWTPPPAGSQTAELAAVYSGARHVKAFSTFGVELHRDPALEHGRGVDLQMAGDASAKEAVAAIGERLGYVPIDAGPLRNAAVLENLAILWIHLAMSHGRDVGFALLGR